MKRVVSLVFPFRGLPMTQHVSLVFPFRGLPMTVNSAIKRTVNTKVNGAIWGTVNRKVRSQWKANDTIGFFFTKLVGTGQSSTNSGTMFLVVYTILLTRLELRAHKMVWGLNHIRSKKLGVR